MMDMRGLGYERNLVMYHQGLLILMFLTHNIAIEVLLTGDDNRSVKQPELLYLRYHLGPHQLLKKYVMRFQLWKKL